MGDDVGRGMRTTIRLASAPIASTFLSWHRDGHHAGSAYHDPAVAHVDERVGGSEIDPDVAGEDAEERVEHVRGTSSRGSPGGSPAAGAPLRLGARGRRVRPMRAAAGVYPGGGARPGTVAPLLRGGRPAARGAAVEGHTAVPQGDEGVVADHDVVQQLDVEEPSGCQGLRGQVEVVR